MGLLTITLFFIVLYWGEMEYKIVNQRTGVYETNAGTCICTIREGSRDRYAVQGRVGIGVSEVGLSLSGHEGFPELLCALVNLIKIFLKTGRLYIIILRVSDLSQPLG